MTQVRRIEFRYLDTSAPLPRARRMSFFLTTRQVLAREKTVTRRAVETWTRLRPGEVVVAVEKGPTGVPAGPLDDEGRARLWAFLKGAAC